MNQYQQFIAKSRYARWDNDLGRRETWEETVNRLEAFWQEKYPDIEFGDLFMGIYALEYVPSMRSLMTAGKALDRDNVAGYNCAYMPIDHPRSFDEMMYILMCGTGMGFSVEKKNVSKLPEVAEAIRPTDTTLMVKDSKKGWAAALKELISMLYTGREPKWNTSKVRAAGKPLKTFGGRASGPEPLERLFKFVVCIFKGAVGRKLTTLETHDICCKIAEVVVVGGVRRSALISLSDVEDTEMQKCKSGKWWEKNPQRALANNSAVYTEKPGMGLFMEEWSSLYESKSGERGTFSRPASEKQVLGTGRREGGHDWGTNPCSEIILRPYQFC